MKKVLIKRNELLQVLENQEALITCLTTKNRKVNKEKIELQQRIDKAAEDLATLFGTDDEDINCIIRNLKGEE